MVYLNQMQRNELQIFASILYIYIFYSVTFRGVAMCIPLDNFLFLVLV